MIRMTKARVVIVALIIGTLALLVFFASSEAVPESGFAIITNGMTESQVSSLLGTPHGVRREADHTTFGYGGFRRLKWCTMEVRFDASGRVVSKFHDH